MQYKDLYEIRNIPGIRMAGAMGYSNWGAQMVCEGMSYNISYTGYDAEFQAIDNIMPVAGRLLNNIDMDKRRKVCLLSKYTAENILGENPDYQQALGKKVGIDAVYNTRESDYNADLIDCFGPDKADIIYDCAGNDITMNSAIRSARKGSTIILVAVYAGMANVDLAVLNDHELDLNTTMMYRHEDYEKAIELVNEKKIDLESLMSNTFPFMEYQKAYEYIDQNREKAMKVLIDLEA